MINNSSSHNRRSIRLRGYDYTSEGGYFITIVTHNREHLFGTIKDGQMQLTDSGIIAREEWFRTTELRPYVDLSEDEFIVMPNHIHGIIWLTDGGTASRFGHARAKREVRRAPTMDQIPAKECFGKPVSGSIPTIVRAFKSTVTKRVNLLQGTPSQPVWQRNYYEHIITTDHEYETITEYIYSNPMHWGTDSENT